MSGENLETVRRHIEVWNRRDLTKWLASFHPDAEIDWSRSRGPLKGVYRGHGELETFWGEFWSTFEDVQLETHGLTEEGSEVVFSNTAHMRGREGIEVSASERARIQRSRTARSHGLRLFQDRAEALEAVGLRE